MGDIREKNDLEHRANMNIILRAVKSLVWMEKKKNEYISCIYKMPKFEIIKKVYHGWNKIIKKNPS